MIQRKLSSLTLPWPVDWNALFGVARPRLILEIGFGNGDYLIHLAHSNPDAHVIGVEIANQSLEKAESKIRHQGLMNACVVLSRGETALHHLFRPASLDEVHVNYPDPWFKTRHAERRLMQRATLEAITSRLKTGGHFYLATDILEYAQMSDELLRSIPGLVNVLPAPWLDALPGRILTKYEEKGQREGRPGKYFHYQRSAEAGPLVPLMEEIEMPHVVLQTPLTLPQIAARFEKLAHQAGEDIHVAITHAFVDAKEKALLFEANIEEPTIDQHVALLLTARETPGEYTLRFSTIGIPRPTLGLHRATGFLADWVVGLHPDGRIIERKVRA